MKTALFDYHLPSEKIAQHPLEPRDSSRILLCNREERIEKREKSRNFEEIIFRDITQLFRS